MNMRRHFNQTLQHRQCVVAWQGLVFSPLGYSSNSVKEHSIAATARMLAAVDCVRIHLELSTTSRKTPRERRRPRVAAKSDSGDTADRMQKRVKFVGQTRLEGIKSANSRRMTHTQSRHNPVECSSEKTKILHDQRKCNFSMRHKT
eukprot:4431212-Pleurochrysis_carterae.AAC.3